MIGPPYSSDFVASMLPLVKNEEISALLKTADQQDDVTLFLSIVFIFLFSFSFLFSHLIFCRLYFQVTVKLDEWMPHRRHQDQAKGKQMLKKVPSITNSGVKH